MTSRLATPLDDRLAELEAENRKLRKINKVLMDRVERDMDTQGGNAFSLFQTAVTLESRVRERTAELTGLTRQLRQEISERREAEAALHLAKAEAEQANLSKTKFLAAASHDLKQPLNAAKLFVGVLAEEVEGERVRGLVDNVEDALEAFDDLLNALLDISKLDAGVWVAEPAGVPVGPLLARLAREYTPQAAAAGLSVRVVPTSFIAHTDRCLLERVVRNFVSNAIRYTERGRILIGCRRCADAIRIEVWDTGIGIPGDKLAHIFEEFRQLGNNPRRGDKGVGLGLAIVDRIARLLGVRITVRSRLGHGSCFGVTLPLGSFPEAAAESPIAPPMLNAGLAGRFVAVVDNDAQVVQAMATLLGTWGCRLVASASAEGILDALEEAAQRPDLIIADYFLDDGRYGTEVIAMLRAQFGPVPTLIMSSDRSLALKAEAQALGCGFLAKPASPAKLRAMLSFLLSQTADGGAERWDVP